VVFALFKFGENRVISGVTTGPGAAIILPTLDALLGGLLQWILLLAIGGLLVAVVAFFANKGRWFAAAWRWLLETYANLYEHVAARSSSTVR
jgi:hypothetical protein